MRIVLLCLFCALGCSPLLAVRPAATAPEREAITRDCLAAFPKGLFRVSHSIDASMPFGHSGVFVGVSAAEPKGFRSILMSIEGFVLFDATLVEGKLDVHRAMPPLDRPGFAQGLMGDVRRTFFPPQGEPAVAGHSPAGIPVCRWNASESRTVDVYVTSASSRVLRDYDGVSLTREIRLAGHGAQGFFPEVDLQVFGIGGYTLRMRLLDQELAPSAPSPALSEEMKSGRP